LTGIGFRSIPVHRKQGLADQFSGATVAICNSSATGDGFSTTKGEAMSSVRVPGSVYRRESGRWAAVTSPVFDPEAGRRRRISLGTFETREDALGALAGFRDDRMRVDVGRQRLGEYLARWLELVRSQVEVGIWPGGPRVDTRRLSASTSLRRSVMSVSVTWTIWWP
jgi:hypothetical protein